MLISSFQDRKIIVKWHNHVSEEQKLNGGGPQGSTIGLQEYLAQSNKNSNCVECGMKFKFVDDLTILEIIRLLSVGMASYNSKNQVANDILTSNLIIPAENLDAQNHINQIQNWTNEQQIILNEEKTKIMIFNFTKTHQFTTRIKLKEKNVEIVEKMKLLGTIITKNLKWHENTNHIVKKAWGRM